MATETQTTLYELLGVSSDASADDIKAAYRSLLKTVHPDTGGNSALFRTVQSAFEVLSDPRRRSQYDESLSGGTAGESSQPPPPPREEARTQRTSTTGPSTGRSSSGATGGGAASSWGKYEAKREEAATQRRAAGEMWRLSPAFRMATVGSVLWWIALGIHHWVISPADTGWMAALVGLFLMISFLPIVLCWAGVSSHADSAQDRLLRRIVRYERWGGALRRVARRKGAKRHWAPVLAAEVTVGCGVWWRAVWRWLRRH